MNPQPALPRMPAGRDAVITSSSAGSSSYRPTFHPFTTETVNKMDRKSKGITKHLPWLKKVESDNTFLHLFISMHEDIRAMTWPKAQPVTAGLLLLPLGASGLISLTTSLLFWGFQVSPQMSYQPLWLLTWDSRAYPIPYFCKPDAPTPAKPWPESCLFSVCRGPAHAGAVGSRVAEGVCADHSAHSRCGSG